MNDPIIQPSLWEDIKAVGQYLIGRIIFIFLYCSLLIFLVYHTFYSVYCMLTGKRLKKVDLE